MEYHQPLDPSREHDLDLTRRARQLGLLASEHPVVQRLKRLEEIIREDSELRELWAELEEFDASSGCGSGGCGSGGCSSGGCGTSAPEETSPKLSPVAFPQTSTTAASPRDRMDLYARFSEAPVLQEYVQIRHRFYVLVDGLVETLFQTLYGQPWQGTPEVSPLREEPGPVGFAGVPLVDVLPDDAV